MRAGGIEHVTMDWQADRLLLVARTPATAAAAAGRLTGRVGVGEGCSIIGVRVGLDLVVTPATFRVARVGERRWRFVGGDGADGIAVDLDEDGIPRLEGETWPLEIDHGIEDGH